jgi:hypothetical protein
MEAMFNEQHYSDLKNEFTVVILKQRRQLAARGPQLIAEPLLVITSSFTCFYPLLWF